jgi:hypothetical protein
MLHTLWCEKDEIPMLGMVDAMLADAANQVTSDSRVNLLLRCK